MAQGTPSSFSGARPIRALRLVVEREGEIDAFVPEEYWTVEAEFRPQGLKETFIAKLAKVDTEDPKFSQEAEVKPVLADMEASAYTISKIKRGERRRTPRLPSSPAPCSRKPPASWVTLPGAPWLWLSTVRRPSTWVKAQSV